MAPVVLWAQDTPATDEAAGAAVVGKETVLSLILKGGPLMYPIFLCSLIIVTMALERLISLRRARVGDVGILTEVTDLIPSRKRARGAALNEATETCTDSGTLLGELLAVGLPRLQRDEKHVQEALEEASAKELHRLQRRLRPFSIVATLAPLLGLLGTVLGMILCFGEASTAVATERAQTLSDGIYRALVTTAAGLTVAIPAMVLNYYFQGRVDRVLDQIDDLATRFIDHYFTPQDDAMRDAGSAIASADSSDEGEEDDEDENVVSSDEIASAAAVASQPRRTGRTRLSG